MKRIKVDAVVVRLSGVISDGRKRLEYPTEAITFLRSGSTGEDKFW